MNNINTLALQQFLNQVKAADLSNQKEIRLDIVTAKALASNIGLVMTRLAGDYETLIQSKKSESNTISVSMDGGQW